MKTFSVMKYYYIIHINTRDLILIFSFFFNSKLFENHNIFLKKYEIRFLFQRFIFLFILKYSYILVSTGHNVLFKSVFHIGMVQIKNIIITYPYFFFNIPFYIPSVYFFL